MPRRKIKKIDKKLLKLSPKRPHRKFYVDGKLEFSLFFDQNIKEKEKILKLFLEDKLWKWHCKYFGLEIEKTNFSKDLTEVYIETKQNK